MNEAHNDTMVRAYWYMSNNLGDSLNELIIRSLSDKYVLSSVAKKEPHYIVCGSILSESNANSIVWGAGFSWEHHRNSDLYGCENVIAVRGDLSAERTGFEVEHIGDPALLLPLLFPKQRTPYHKVGIIPHWTNIETAIERFPNEHVISPLLPFDLFIESILSCECILSESLHGLIISDAYRVPSQWIDLGADVGDKFKYHDYYSSTKTPTQKPASDITTNQCEVHEYKYDLISFLNSCPFLNKNRQWI